MFARLFVLFVTIPLIELYLLFRLYDFTQSAVSTIGLIVITGMLGAWLAKQQGLSTISKIQRTMSQGAFPAQELMDGGMILFAAALLLTPGILTDAFGFSLLFPPCRTVYRRLLKRYLPKPNISVRSTGFHTGFGTTGSPFDPNVVDAESRSVHQGDSDTLEDHTSE